MPSRDVYSVECNHDATAQRGTQHPFRLTDAPLAPAVELRALQVIVVTVMTGVVLVVVAVVFVVLGRLDNIVSRTSSKQKAAMLITSHGKRSKTQTQTAHPTNEAAMSL